jgi:hypothetical protein
VPGVSSVGEALAGAGAGVEQSWCGGQLGRSHDLCGLWPTCEVRVLSLGLPLVTKENDNFHAA